MLRCNCWGYPKPARSPASTASPLSVGSVTGTVTVTVIGLQLDGPNRYSPGRHGLPGFSPAVERDRRSRLRLSDQPADLRPRRNPRRALLPASRDKSMGAGLPAMDQFVNLLFRAPHGSASGRRAGAPSSPLVTVCGA